MILDEKYDFQKFTNMGWTKGNIEKHLKKENNFSIGLFINNKIYGILIGETIVNDHAFDLEVHIMFVTKKNRRTSIGSKILNFIELNNNLTKITKIYLEVSENNLEAIKFYEKNNFVFFKFRHNYYNDKNENINAKCYMKKI